MMSISRKTVALFIAVSMAATPIAASAASGSARAVSTANDANELEGNSSWLIGLLGLAAGIAAIVIISSNDDDAPVSP